MGADEEEVPHVVLQRYAGHWEIVTYPTSRIVRANCGHLAWLSPQGEAMAAANYTICTDCYDAGEWSKDEPQQTVPGAVQALEKLWGAEVASEIRREMRRRGIEEK